MTLNEIMKKLKEAEKEMKKQKQLWEDTEKRVYALNAKIKDYQGAIRVLTSKE